MFIFNGLKAAVTISGTVATGLPQASSVQSLVAATYTGGLNTNYSDVYTVTNGKTFYVMGIYAAAEAGFATSEVIISDNGTAKIGLGGAAGVTPQAVLPCPMAFTTKVQAKVSVSSVSACHITVVGYEA